MIKRFGDAPFILDTIRHEMDQQNHATIDHISEQRMRGNDGKPFAPELHILGVRSSRLLKSLRASPATMSGARVTSAIGTNVVYAGMHEEGFEGEVTVAPHKRKKFTTQVFSAGYMRLGKRKTVRRKVRGADISVGSHKRLMKIPARAPITTGIEERLDAIGDAVSDAIIAAGTKNL
jgi:phage gpG-like protein